MEIQGAGRGPRGCGPRGAEQGGHRRPRHVRVHAGPPGGQIALAAGASFDKLRISFANVTWWLDGGTRETACPTLHDLLNLRDGDYCGVLPPPSKADQFGSKWMNNTIWLIMKQVLKMVLRV